MKMFKRTLAMLLCLVMAVGLMAMGVSAADATTIDATAKGSITIHKYESSTKGPNGDGTTNATIPEGAKPLKDVTFTLYQVMNSADTIAYYNGTSTNTVDVSTYVENGALKSGVTAITTTTAKTDENGEATFSDLPVGMYVVIETAYPDKVTAPAEPFLVSIPMANPDGETQWMYDVNVYPKNSTSVGSVTLNKKGESNASIDASFLLQKKDANGNWTNVDTYSTTNGTVTIANLAHGDYQFIEQSVVADGYVVDKTPITFTIDANSTVEYTSTTRANVTATGDKTKALTLNITNEKPDVTKEAASTGLEGVGETIPFTVTVEVPTNIKDMTSFTLTDAPINLDVDSGSIVVKDNNTALTKGTNYTVEDSADGCGFTMTFTLANMGNYAGKTLTVTYNATVLASAATTGQSGNEVTLTYDDGVREQTDTDDTTQKNYTIQITKYKDSVNANNVAAGVKFTLSEDGTLVNVIKNADGSYRVAAANETGALTEMETTSAGLLKISGLSAGTYKLTETKAPDGYNLLSAPIEITLTGNTTLHTQDVINKAGFTLPKTGGLGTLMFILIGGVLMAGGVVLLTSTGKKRAQ